MILNTFTTIALPISLALIMFSMGLSLLAKSFTPLIKQPRAVAIGLFGQLICVPLLAFSIVLLTGLSGVFAVGLMVLSFSPGGTTSNLFSFLAKGDVPLSISLTALAGFLTPISLPLLTAWVLQWQSIDSVTINFPIGLTVIKLVIVTLLPLTLGMLWRKHYPTSAALLMRITKPLAIGLFSVVITAMVSQHWSKLGNWIEHLGTPIVIMILVALSMGWGLARIAGLNCAQRKTISIEVGMQNGGTALLITQGVLSDPKMSSVPILYGLLMLLPVLLLVWSARR